MLFQYFCEPNLRFLFKGFSFFLYRWHSHAGNQRADGLFGSIVIREPEFTTPYGDLYDYDLPEHIIMVTDWFHEVFLTRAAKFNHFDKDPLSNYPDSILMNGRGNPLDGDYTGYHDYVIFDVEPGKRYRFRSIYTGIYSCQIQISIDEHKLTLISTDGNPVRPFEIDSIYMDGGDRYDFVIETDKKIGNYWLKVEVCILGYLPEVFARVFLMGHSRGRRGR